MAIKTFNINEEVYKKFSKFCKEKGISMSKQIENFMRKHVENAEILEKGIEKAIQETLKDNHKKYIL